jgi:hypothetical protein
VNVQIGPCLTCGHDEGETEPGTVDVDKLIERFRKSEEGRARLRHEVQAATIAIPDDFPVGWDRTLADEIAELDRQRQAFAQSLRDAWAALPEDMQEHALAYPRTTLGEHIVALAMERAQARNGWGTCHRRHMELESDEHVAEVVAVLRELCDMSNEEDPVDGTVRVSRIYYSTPDQKFMREATPEELAERFVRRTTT